MATFDQIIVLGAGWECFFRIPPPWIFWRKNGLRWKFWWGILRYDEPMNNLNRKRHTVVFSDTAWEKYSSPVDGYVMVGTVDRGGHVGALAIKDGRHFCVINGMCEPLVERKIALGIEHATYA